MIVWNVAERWFALKAEAEAYRRGAGYKPDATRRAEIVTREQMADLLNHGTVTLPAAIPKPAKVDPRQIDMFPAATIAGLEAVKAALEEADNSAEIAATNAVGKSPLLPAGFYAGIGAGSVPPAAISTGEERVPPDDPDDGRPIARTPQAFDIDEPDERDMASGKIGLNPDGSRFDLETGEVL